MSVLFNMPWQQAFDGSGNTIAGARLYFYEGGTSTPKNVYADVGLGVPLSQPVVADGSGRFPPIYLDNGAYKVRFCNAENALIWSADNIYTYATPVDATVASAAVRATSISAGYTEEEAEDPTNFVKSIYKYANSANWYVENVSSVADAYVLNGLDDFTRLDDYFLGQNVWFVTQNANTVATATVNVANLGAKRIYRPDNTPIEAGDVYGLVHLVYNGSSFTIQPAQVNQHGEQTIYDTKTFNDSPLVPTLTGGDNSQKAVNSAYLKNIIDALKPNYSAMISLTEGHYTPTKNGVVYVTARSGNNCTAVFVNGQMVIWTWGHSGSSHGQPVPAMTVLVGAGDLVQISGSRDSVQEISNFDRWKFVPYGNYPTTGNQFFQEG